MKNWHWFDTAYATLLVIAGVAIIGFIVYGIRDCSAQQRCEDLGGHVEKYGCHTVWVTTSCGVQLHHHHADRVMRLALRWGAGREALTYTP